MMLFKNAAGGIERVPDPISDDLLYRKEIFGDWRAVIQYVYTEKAFGDPREVSAWFETVFALLGMDVASMLDTGRSSENPLGGWKQT